MMKHFNLLLPMVFNPHINIGMEIAELLVRSKLCVSKTQARKAIQEGSIKISNERVKDPFARLCLYKGRYILLEDFQEKRNAAESNS